MVGPMANLAVIRTDEIVDFEESFILPLLKSSWNQRPVDGQSDIVQV